MVGMTGMPEAVIARELGLEYAACGVVINRAAGCGGEDIHEQIEANVAAVMKKVRTVLSALQPGAD
jgi:5'-methylthioinosine phosphorylase